MLTEMILTSGIIVAVLGVLEGAWGPRWRRSSEMRAESEIREAMRGPEGASVRAEFRRSGISPPEPPRRTTFL